MTAYIISGIISGTSAYCCARYIKLPNPSEIALFIAVHNIIQNAILNFSEGLQEEISEHKLHHKLFVNITTIATVIGSYPAILWFVRKMEFSTPNMTTFIGISLGSQVVSLVVGTSVLSLWLT